MTVFYSAVIAYRCQFLKFQVFIVTLHKDAFPELLQYVRDSIEHVAIDKFVFTCSDKFYIPMFSAFLEGLAVEEKQLSSYGITNQKQR